MANRKSSGVFQLTQPLTLRWKVQLPKQEEEQEQLQWPVSPTFTWLNNQWFMKCAVIDVGICLSLHCRREIFSPFSVCVQVEDGTVNEEVLPKWSHTTYHVTQGTSIWLGNQEILQLMLPEWKSHRQLTFRVTFHEKDLQKCSSGTLKSLALKFMWTVELPSDDITISSDIRFRNAEWCLWCIPNNKNNNFSLHLRCLSRPPFRQFVVSVQVENRSTGRIMPDLSDNTFNWTPENSGIWSRNIEDIERADPVFKSDRRLTFRVSFGKVEPPTRENCTFVNHIPCLESLTKDLIKHLDDGSDTDVEFLCEGHSTMVHESVLLSRSPVLAAMLESDMVEGRTRVITIPDMDLDIFRQFLDYLHTGELDNELTFDAAVSLYEAGDKYDVKSLTRRCSRVLMEHMTAENACYLLALADAHSDSFLVEVAVDFILENEMNPSNACWRAFSEEVDRRSRKMLSQYT